MSKKILVTGAAGFIGFHVCKRLLDEGVEVVGLDNCSYPQEHLRHQIKRLEVLDKYEGFYWVKGSVIDRDKVREIFDVFKPEKVIHLAASAGVRASLDDPSSTILNNIVGFNVVANLAHQYRVKNFVYASSGSVYGDSGGFSDVMPLKNKPKSFYAASKISNELDAYVLWSNYGFKSIGLRFFSVYGPYARPDSIFMKFSDCIEKGEEIYLFNHGLNRRDFTYVDDVVSAVIASTSSDFNGVLNIGRGQCHPVSLVVELLSQHLSEPSPRIIMQDAQPGDVVDSQANISSAYKHLNYKPTVDLVTGISNFMKWYIPSELT